VEKTRRYALDQLATSDGDAKKIALQAQKVILKKTSARRNLTDTKIEANATAREGLTIRGLKKKEAPVIEKPYDPFGGLDLTPTKYVLQKEYDSEWLQIAKSDARHTAAGWSIQEYYSRSMFEAFSGLGVFIEDEVADRDQTTSAGVATAAAAQAPVA